MNNDERLKQTINAWRVEQGFEPFVLPDVNVPIKPRTVAYRIGWAVGAGMASAVALAALAAVVYLVWRLA